MLFWPVKQTSVNWNHVSLQRKVKESPQTTHYSRISSYRMPETTIHQQHQKINLQAFMEKNFRCDMSMSEFATSSGRSLSTFKRDFKKMSPLSPERWLTNRRLLEAFELLRHGRRVSDACFDVGFKNVSHFSAIFKKKFGITPGEARKGKEPVQ